MSLLIAETRVPIMLDQERYLTFNVNCMCAYEKATGKFFLETVARLYDAFPKRDGTSQGASSLETNPSRINPMDLLRKIPIEDLRALI